MRFALMAQILIWLVLPEQRLGRANERIDNVKRCYKSSSTLALWKFWNQFMGPAEMDVINWRLFAVGFPPWPNNSWTGDAAKCASHDFDIKDTGPWAAYSSQLHHAAGRILGAAVVDAPGTLAVTQLQMHTAEHRVWHTGAAPHMHGRLVTFKIIDIVAIGSFMWPEFPVCTQESILHPVVKEVRGHKSGRAKKITFDTLSDDCVKDLFISNCVTTFVFDTC